VNLNLSPVSALSWSWRALRGHSVTFAALFALGILGVSAIAEFRHFLTRIGAPWYAWLLIPIFALTYLAKKEVEWMPEATTRRRWARGLFFGSIVIAIAIAKFGPKRHPAASTAAPAAGVAGSK
jgi:hypothetical protein